MKKIYKSALVLILLVASSLSNAQDLVHYWNFNDNTSIAAITTPTLSLVAGASIIATNNVSGTLIDPTGGTGQNFDVLNLNAQNGDVAGSHLRYNNPIGGYLEFALPTTGYENIVVRFATRRSGSGADDQQWFYSMDAGLTYQLFTTIHPANGDPTLQTLDFSALTDANDNPDFKLKVEFAQGAGGISGNNRFDNFTVKATPTAGDTTAPLVTLTPADAATNVAVNANLSISFNEEVRLLDNTTIDNTNVNTVVELRLNDAAGALVPFNATYADNTITINPTSDLANGQQYYMALLPNTIEDLSDNAVTDVQAALFTTVIAQDLIHYWNFNNNASIAALTTPTISLVAGASIQAVAGGTSVIDPAGGTGQNFDVLNLNAQNGDAAGSHLRFNEPIGGALEFALPTTGFEQIVVRFATRRSGSGADDQLWSYSVDGGTTYTAWTTVHPANGDPTLQIFDFAAIPTAQDNANFKLKVEFAQGAGGIAGNNRFDNFTVNGSPIGGDSIEPIVTITPADATTNVALDTHPTISFNEDVRLVNNDAIDDTNVDALVELRIGDALGLPVAFDATFSGNVITVTPSAGLDNGQDYYVALLPNTVEDLSDNAVTDTHAAVFSTVAAQEEFTAGDFAIVAYRMSATATEDEIAFVTFVDIPDGTNINFTDSKYTTNAQPQCPNGIVWTAEANSCIPAGSVITIRTNALTSNHGTVTGAGFGLSSNGDQVIVYTGSADAPNYITAFSSNAWLATNTDCGGSFSMLPAGLTDGTTSLNMSTAPGNVSGNTANGFYNGTNDGEPADLRAAILNPANWTTSPSNTAAQTWPAWTFPKALEVTAVDADLVSNTIVVTFDSAVDPATGSDVFNYEGLDNLTTATVSGNQVTLTYAAAFPTGINTLMIGNVSGTTAQGMACSFVYEFDGTLATTRFSKNNEAFVLYPNPSQNGTVYFNKSVTVSVFDATGKLLMTADHTKSIDTSALSSGLYLVKTAEGNSAKLIVK